MNILITGGAGFIGSHLVKLHLNKGDNVFVVDNLITGNINNLNDTHKEKLTFINKDVVTYNLKDLPSIDFSYALASPASPIQYKKYKIETMLANSLGTYHLLELLKNRGCKRMVLASTSEVYGDPLEHPQKETYFGNVNPIGERSCYDEAKRYAEALAMSYFQSFNLDIRIARIFNTYGPNMELNDGRVVSNFIIQALKNDDITIYGNGLQTRSFCYVSDLVSGLYKLQTTQNLNGQVINLGNPEEKTVSELALLIKNLTNSSSKITYNEIGGDDPKKRKPDITKATEKLNFQPIVSLNEGLAKTIPYFKEKIRL